MNFGKEEVFRNGEKFRGYVVERLLGNGSLGAVYLVRHEILDRSRRAFAIPTSSRSMTAAMTRRGGSTTS